MKKYPKKHVRVVKMNKLKIIILMIGVLALVILSGCSNNTSETTQDNLAQITSQGLDLKSSGSTGAGDVLVELTPHKMTNGKLEVDIVVNTHSVTLTEFNLKEITMLEYDGELIKPIETPSLSGHHSSGTLVFDIGANVDAYTITIIGLAKVEKRIFTWD